MQQIKIPQNLQVEDKVLPYDLNAEEAIIGALISGTNEVEKVLMILNSSDFYKTLHKKIYKTLSMMLEAGETVDLITFTTQARKDGYLSSGEEVSYVAHLSSKHDYDTNVVNWALIIKDTSMRRKIIEHGWKLSAAGHDMSDDVFSIHDKFQSSFQAIMPNFETKDVGVEDSIKEIDEAIDLYTQGLGVGISSGLKGIDENVVTRGGKLIIIGARPSMGKSAIGIQIAMNIVDIENRDVGFVSAEMPKVEIHQRIAANATRIDLDKIINGRLNRFERNKVVEAIKKYGSRIHIIAGSRFHINDIKQKAARMVAEHNITALFADYIQRFSGKGDNRTAEIGHISFGLKEMALELNIPVYAFSQLSRAVEARSNKEPMMSDLRESGDIEQDADVILFLYRPSYYMTAEELVEKNISEEYAIVKCSKNRQGKIFMAKMKFFGMFQRWEDNIYSPPKLKISNNQITDDI
jgi:replicative DNA helicase